MLFAEEYSVGLLGCSRVRASNFLSPFSTVDAHGCSELPLRLPEPDAEVSGHSRLNLEEKVLQGRGLWEIRATLGIIQHEKLGLLFADD